MTATATAVETHDRGVAIEDVLVLVWRRGAPTRRNLADPPNKKTTTTNKQVDIERMYACAL